MRIAIVFPVILSCFIALKSSGQIYGEGVVFTHDAVGNRTQRELKSYTLLANKNGIVKPVDTLIDDFQTETKKIIVRSYPNPATDQLVVENLSWQDTDRAMIRLLDITGKLIYESQTTRSKEQVPLTAIAYGTYQVHYYLNGKFLTSWKIVKN